MYSRKKVVIGFSLVVLVVLFLPNSIVNGNALALSGKRGLLKVDSNTILPVSDIDLTVICDTASVKDTPFVHDVKITLPPVENATDSLYSISRLDRVHVPYDNFCIVAPFNNVTKIGQHVSPTGNWMLGDGQGITLQSDGTQWYVIGTLLNPSIEFSDSNSTIVPVPTPPPQPEPEPTTYPSGYCPLWLHLAGQCS